MPRVQQTLEAPFRGEHTPRTLYVAARPWEKKLGISHEKRLKKSSPRVS